MQIDDPSFRAPKRFLRIADLVAGLFTPRDRVREEVSAMAHALRVRAALAPDEQRAFDQLVTDYPETALGMLIDRTDEEALAAIRRHLASVALTFPSAASPPSGT